MPELTKQQAEVLEYLRDHPTASINDIREKFEFASRNAVHWHVRKLEGLGLLKRPEISRSGWVVSPQESHS